jgi:hypothetical protein
LGIIMASLSPGSKPDEASFTLHARERSRSRRLVRHSPSHHSIFSPKSLNLSKMKKSILNSSVPFPGKRPGNLPRQRADMRQDGL